MSSILHRRKAIRERTQAQTKTPGVVIPAWSELRSMKADQVKPLAAALGIEYTTIGAVKSALNAARG